MAEVRTEPPFAGAVNAHAENLRICSSAYSAMQWNSPKRPFIGLKSRNPKPPIRCTLVQQSICGTKRYFAVIAPMTATYEMQERLSATKSQPCNLLSIATLNETRSRRFPASSRRARIAQTSLGRSGRFFPKRRSLFQARRFGVTVVAQTPGMICPPSNPRAQKSTQR